MIRVSRLDGTEFVVNAELIELIETTPDTVLSLTDDKKFIVREPLDEVVARVVAYRQRAYAAQPVHAAADAPAQG
jgi:flagellar protein FlbD